MGVFTFNNLMAAIQSHGLTESFLLPMILNMSITGSLTILFVLLVRLAVKRAPKIFSYALWAVVLFRLLCPVSITTDFSLLGLFDTPIMENTEHTTVMEYVPFDVVHTRDLEVHLPVIPVINEAVNDVLPQEHAALGADPLEGEMAIASFVWLLGVAAMAVYSVVSYYRLRQKLLTASPLRDNIYLADEITSPFVMGLVRPKIYLPSDMEEREQAYIIRHEQHHIRRGDHIIKALAFLALSIHWFNPLVWVAFIYSNKDMEMSCDEAVVKKMGDGILADYTASLLSLATGKHIIAGMPLAFGEGDTKGRIRNLANWRKPAFWVVMVAMVACFAMAICLMTNPKGISIYEIIEEDGYTIMKQEQVEVTLSIPKDVLSDRIYSEEGQQFKEKEVIVYQTDETIIFLDEVRVSNESNDLLYFTFGYSLNLPKSGTVIVPFSVIKNGGSAAIYPDDSLASDSGTYKDAIHMRGEHAGGFAFYVSADACKEASGTMKIKGYCIKLTYAQEGKEAEMVDTEDQYYLLIGTDGVVSIQITGINSSGGVVHADGSAFKNGEKVWLEPLQGVTDLRGISITAFGTDGEILYAFSVPEGASDAVITEIVGSDSWLLAPTSSGLLSEHTGVSEDAITPVTWTYSPMMSATWHAAFHFNFGLANYSHIEASCDNGTLWNLRAQGQPREKTMRFEAGEPLCWMPGVGNSLTDTAESAKVTFTVYAGGEIVAKGVLDINRTGTENGQSFYEAYLTETQILALQQEPGSLEASVVFAGNGAVVAYSDANHNRINERVIVREVHPGMVYELCVVEDGAVIWSTEASPAHAGWNTVMRYSEDGQDYLVQYQPAMFQGVGNYRCTVFYLDGGEEVIKKEWTTDFELPVKETPEMERFAQEVGVLLRNCSVLLSTEQGIVVKEHAMATALPQLYPVRFDPDEIQSAIDGTDVAQKLTSNAASFPDEPLNLMYASGAGGWGSLLTLQPDGSFTGDYRDSEMGANAPEYPNGSCYVSIFEGHFTDIQQINDYAWSMKLGALTTERIPEETWIADGVRYIAAEAAGVAGGEEFILLAPGTPADEIPTECRDWWPDAYLWRSGEVEQLEGWGLCNLNEGTAFFTTWMQ